MKLRQKLQVATPASVTSKDTSHETPEPGTPALSRAGSKDLKERKGASVLHSAVCRPARVEAPHLHVP